MSPAPTWSRYPLVSVGAGSKPSPRSSRSTCGHATVRRTAAAPSPVTAAANRASASRSRRSPFVKQRVEPLADEEVGGVPRPGHEVVEEHFQPPGRLRGGEPGSRLRLVGHPHPPHVLLPQHLGQPASPERQCRPEVARPAGPRLATVGPRPRCGGSCRRPARTRRTARAG